MSKPIAFQFPHVIPAATTANLDKYLALVGNLYYQSSETAGGDHDVRRRCCVNAIDRWGVVAVARGGCPFSDQDPSLLIVFVVLLNLPVWVNSTDNAWSADLLSTKT